MSKNVLYVLFIYLYKVEIKYMLQEFGTTEVFKGYSNMRQTEDNMFQQNKYSGEYTEVAKSNSNMRQTNMRQIEDNMFHQKRFLGEYAEVVNGNSNLRQTNMRYNEDNMFQPNRFLGEYAEVGKGYSANMRQNEDNTFPPNRFVGEYITNNKVGGIFCCCIIFIIQ